MAENTSGAASSDPASPERLLASACREAGVRYLFGVPGGGSNLDLIGAMEAESIPFVLTHTETAGAIMAGTVAELTGRPGVCLATRGPGAASVVNGVAQALLDRQPMLVVTDSVSGAESDRVSHQRLDQQQLFAAVAKASFTFGSASLEATRSLVQYALSGRPGPVHVQIDRAAAGLTVQDQQAGAAMAEVGGGGAEQAMRLLAEARRLVVVAGVGATTGTPEQRARTARAIESLAQASGSPVLTTYKARGMVDDAAPWAAGVATGATIEAPVLAAADVILGIGVDPVELIPAAWPYPAPMVLLSAWACDDSHYFGDQLRAELVGDIASLTEEAATRVSSGDWTADAGQRFQQQSLAELQAAVPGEPRGLLPQEIVQIARAAAAPDTIATVDAGAHMLPAMALWQVGAPGELLNSSGLATMGYALPAAIAAALLHPERAVICFTGDGGLGMVLGELETVARLALHVIVVVFNDSSLSLIAAKQRPEGHGGIGAVQYRGIDFAGIARACGLAAAAVDDVEGYEEALSAALGRRGPTLIDARTDPSGYPAVLGAVRGARDSVAVPGVLVESD